ncbi:MAG: hypothetical protein AB7I27_11275 [Bacteriovoracaceae bacterium]
MKIKLSSVALTATLLTLASCNEYSIVPTLDNISAQKLIEDTQEEHYQVTLSSLNNVSQEMTGSGDFKLMGENLISKINISGAPALTQHAQFIYSGSTCPSDLDDANGDGFIDAAEVQNSVGSKVLALEEFPMADSNGNYVYQGTVKVNSNQIEGKVLLITGVSEEETLPSSVSSGNEDSVHSSLPIACGIIEKVTSSPSENEIPMPENTHVQRRWDGGKGGK